MKEYTSSTRKRSSSARPVLLAILVAFLFGGALAGYAVYRFKDRPVAAQPAASLPDPALASPTGSDPEPTPSATASQASQQAVARVAEQQGGLDQRLTAAEQRLSKLDLQAQASAGNAARAEGLLIAFATRRALEKGQDLGFLADQLRLRFGDAKPNAVATLIQAGKNPITLDQLIARLQGLGPQLAGPSNKTGFARFREELSQLFVIRSESAPSPQPERRLERARLFLESGRTEAAIAEVRATPGAADAANWIKDAERYAAVQQALDLIETSAVLEPRLLRDATGHRIEQPGVGEAPPVKP